MTTLPSSAAHSDRDRIFEQAAAAAAPNKGSGGPPRDALPALLPAYYRHVATEELASRTDVDVYGALASHHHLALDRDPGVAKVRVFTPTVAEHGWSAAGHSVVEVVVDDMPFLVDSLTMELSRQLHDVRAVIHPTFDVRRDENGRLLEAEPVASGSTAP
ncbi:hypothetical protein GUY44_16060, partial [Pimelobacter simplex]